MDKDKNPIPDRLFQTKDFERVISIEARNKAVAAHLTDFLKKTDRFAKTIVFCTDQDHAEIMRHELHNLNKDLAPDAVGAGSAYVARVTADEGERGAGFLDDFQDLEKDFPVILTTSQLLTTGVGAPTCKNVVLFRTVNSMTEFKQIIGRGTRCREDKGKLFFHIIDYTGSATAKFADPEFDGQPPEVTQEEIDEHGQVTQCDVTVNPEPEEDYSVPAGILPEPGPGRLKLRVHGGPGGIDTEITYDLDASGKQLRAGDMATFAAEAVKELYADAEALRTEWADPTKRAGVLDQIDQRAIDFQVLAAEVGRRTRTRLTCCATSRTNPPCSRDTSGPPSSAPASPGSSWGSRRPRGRCWTRCSTSTSSTGSASSRSRRC